MGRRLERILISVFFVLALGLFVDPAAAGDFFLKQTILEGESQTFEVAGHTYNVTLLSVYDREAKARFMLDGEKTGAMSEDEMYRFSDGTSLQVRDVLPQEAGDGRDLVQYNLFPASRPAYVAEAEDGPRAPVTETPPGVSEALPVPTGTDEPSEDDVGEKTDDDAGTETMEAEPEDMEGTSPDSDNTLWSRIADWLRSLFSR